MDFFEGAEQMCLSSLWGQKSSISEWLCVMCATYLCSLVCSVARRLTLERMVVSHNAISYDSIVNWRLDFFLFNCQQRKTVRWGKKTPETRKGNEKSIIFMASMILFSHFFFLETYHAISFYKVLFLDEAVSQDLFYLWNSLKKTNVSISE